jgi:hypothetical protein
MVDEQKMQLRFFCQLKKFMTQTRNSSYDEMIPPILN